MYQARKFVQSSYDENDAFGRRILIQWLEKQYWVTEVSSTEDYGVDINITDNNGYQWGFEAEVKTNYPWTNADNFKFDTVSFLGRKKKWKDQGFYYALICKETTAMCIAHSSVIYKEEYREELNINTTDRTGADAFYRVPKHECTWVKPQEIFNDNSWKDYTNKIRKSQDAVWAVARYLHSFTYTVTIPALHIAESPDQYNDYVDEGDIILHRDGNKDIVEVKHQSWEWTSHKDIPWKEIIVCAKKAYDRHTNKPAVYFLVNKQLSHALTIPTETYNTWSVKDIHDKQKDWIQTMYMINPNNYKFIEL